MRPKTNYFIMPDDRGERGRIEPLYGPEDCSYGLGYWLAVGWVAYLATAGFVLYHVGKYAWHVMAFAKILK